MKIVFTSVLMAKVAMMINPRGRVFSLDGIQGISTDLKHGATSVWNDKKATPNKMYRLHANVMAFVERKI